MKRLLTSALVLAAWAAIAAAPPAAAQDRLGRLLTIGAGEIGVTVREVTSDDAQKAKIAQPVGVMVESVREGSPAATAGVKAGDIIIDFDGERVRSVRHFTRLVEESAPRREVNVVVIRGTARQTLKVVPRTDQIAGLFSDDARRRLRVVLPSPRQNFRINPDDLAGRLPNFFGAVTGPTLGISVTPLSDQLASYFGVKEGVLVNAVGDDSAAAKAGLKAGDVITAVAGSSVTNANDITRALRDHAGESVDITVTRDKKSMTLKATIERDDRALRRRGLPV